MQVYRGYHRMTPPQGAVVVHRLDGSKAAATELRLYTREGDPDTVDHVDARIGDCPFFEDIYPRRRVKRFGSWEPSRNYPTMHHAITEGMYVWYDTEEGADAHGG